MPRLVRDGLVAIVVVVDVSVVSRDELSFLHFERSVRKRGEIYSLVSSQTSKFQDTKVVQHRRWRRVILPSREMEGTSRVMGVHSLLACRRSSLSFTVSASMDSRLIMVALDSEGNFWW